MRQTVRLLIALTLASLSAAPAFAQNPPTRGPIEASIGIGRMVPRFAVEGFGTAGRRATEYFRRTEGLYGVQIRQRLLPRPTGSFQPFVTYGAAGDYAHVSQPETVIPQPGGGSVPRPRLSYTEF